MWFCGRSFENYWESFAIDVDYIQEFVEIVIVEAYFVTRNDFDTVVKIAEVNISMQWNFVDTLLLLLCIPKPVPFLVYWTPECDLQTCRFKYNPPTPLVSIYQIHLQSISWPSVIIEDSQSVVQWN